MDSSLIRHKINISNIILTLKLSIRCKFKIKKFIPKIHMKAAVTELIVKIRLKNFIHKLIPSDKMLKTS